jgi:hypothetical protein
MHLFPHRGHADTVAPFALLLRWRTPVVDEVATFVRSVAAEPEPDQRRINASMSSCIRCLYSSDHAAPDF